MSVPSWVTGNPSGRPVPMFSPESGTEWEVHPTIQREQEEARRDIPEQRRAKLGRTLGLMAVGAWAARMEIAKTIEEGVPSPDILAAIKDGRESDEPLEQKASPFKEGNSVFTKVESQAANRCL